MVTAQLSTRDSGHVHGVFSIVALDSRSFATSGGDDYVRAWRVVDGNIAGGEQADATMAGYVTLEPLGASRVAAVDMKGVVRLLRVEGSGRLVTTPTLAPNEDDPDGCDRLVGWPSDRFAAWRYGKSSLAIWSIGRAGRQPHVLDRLEQSGIRVSCAVDERSLAVGLASGEIIIWQPGDRHGTGLVTACWAAHAGPVTSVARSEDGLLLTGGPDGEVRCWRIDSSPPSAGPEWRVIVGTGEVRDLSWLDNGRFVSAVSGRRGILGLGWRRRPEWSVWRVAPGGPTVQRRGRGYFHTWRSPLAVVDQPDEGGAIIDLGESDSLRPVRLADAHCRDIRVATFLSPTALITGDSKGGLALWSVNDGRPAITPQ